MRLALILACSAMSACSPRIVTRNAPVTVSVPVSAPCALPRPAKPSPIAGDWTALDVKQKAAAVGEKAIQWRDYGEALDAATAACPEN